MSEHDPEEICAGKRVISQHVDVSRSPSPKTITLLFLLLIGLEAVHARQQRLDRITKGSTFKANALDDQQQRYTVGEVTVGTSCQGAKSNHGQGQFNEITFTATGQRDGKEYYVKFPKACGQGVTGTQEQWRIVQGESYDDFIRQETDNMQALTKAWKQSEQKGEYKPDIPLLVDTSFALDIKPEGLDKLTMLVFDDAILMTKVKGSCWLKHSFQAPNNIRDGVVKVIRWFAEKGFMDLDWVSNTFYDDTAKKVARIDFGLMMVYQDNWVQVCEFVDAMYETIKNTRSEGIPISPSLSLDPNTEPSKRIQAMEDVMRASWKHWVEYTRYQHRIEGEGDGVPFILQDLNNQEPKRDNRTLWIVIGVLVALLVVAAIIYFFACRSSQDEEYEAEDPQTENP